MVKMVQGGRISVERELNNRKIMGVYLVKKIICLIALLILMIPLSSAAHTFDNKSTYQTTAWSTANPGNLSYKAGDGSTVMVLNIFIAGNAYRTTGTPTFRGRNFISLGRNM
ncbi:MAG TPA: hypothetical protein VER35_03080 [Candidatus Limnocylindrales bacterium]|nr:hypothetical protein [Candidatus Limnocylindrales bacterium]